MGNIFLLRPILLCPPSSVSCTHGTDIATFYPHWLEIPSLKLKAFEILTQLIISTIFVFTELIFPPTCKNSRPLGYFRNLWSLNFLQEDLCDNKTLRRLYLPLEMWKIPVKQLLPQNLEIFFSLFLFISIFFI